MEQSSIESQSHQTDPTTQFAKSVDDNTSISSIDPWPRDKPIVRLRIFCNVASRNNSGESSILLTDLPELRKEINISTPSAIFLNSNRAKTKVLDLAEIGDLKDKVKELAGYKVLAIVDQYYNLKKSACFDIKPFTQSLPSPNRQVLKETFINLKETGFNRIVLRSDDIIKMGRQVYRVTIVQDKICPNFKWFKTLKEQNSEISGTCRVCLCSEESNSDFLLSPCACSGSCGYVHLECLRHWLQTRMVIYKNERVIAYNLDVFQCEVCKTDLPKYMKIQEEIVELFPLSIQSESFIMLERICDRSSISYIIPFSSEKTQSISMGRHELNDLILNDMSISRKHAILHIERGQVEISDCNSKFGTFVEFQRNIRKLRKVNLLNDRFTFSLEVIHQ